jgi:[CysO sulfur-carrier protein]-S-L-cysteine hydrolase
MLTIRKSVADAVIAHARAASPLEACGYLAEKDGQIVRFFPLKNVDQSAEHFSFDPAEQFSVMRAIRSGSLIAAAVVHSHPNTPARPSQEDLRLARDPNISYVIVSLAGSEPVVKSFRIRDCQATPEDIVVSQGQS